MGETNEAKRVICKSCNTEATVSTINSFFGHLGSDGIVDAFYCPACYELVKNSGEFRTKLFSRYFQDPDAALVGNFKPVKSKEELIYFRTEAFFGPFWLDLEQSMLQTMNELGPKLLRFTFPGPLFKGIAISPVWSDKEIVGIEAAGDTPSKKLQLSVHQIYRLQKMGFHCEGSNEQIWKIDLLPEEREPSNVARVITHLMEFGYMMRANQITDISPIVDVTSSRERK